VAKSSSPHEVIDAMLAKYPAYGNRYTLFAAASSRQAGQEALRRMYARTEDRDKATTWATREAQYDAVCTWGIPDHARLQQLSAIDVPVLVANGDADPMILPRYSYLLAGLIPHARVKIYPDSAHGFLFQHHAEFAADVEAFLATSH
jgi:pimeloyl-ACP methyl ester carboxylesterase